MMGRAVFSNDLSQLFSTINIENLINFKMAFASYILIFIIFLSGLILWTCPVIYEGKILDKIRQKVRIKDFDADAIWNSIGNIGFSERALKR